MACLRSEASRYIIITTAVSSISVRSLLCFPRGSIISMLRFLRGSIIKHITERLCYSMKQCKVIGCTEKHYSKGLCQKHYMQHRRGTLKETVNDTELLLDSLRQYQEIITTMKNLFTLLDDLLLSVSLDEINRVMEELDKESSNN